MTDMFVPSLIVTAEVDHLPAPDPEARGIDWHHPNYRGETAEGFLFAHFTGGELDPRDVVPDHVHVLANAEYDTPDCSAYRRIKAETEAARVCWQIAQWKRDLISEIRKQLPKWSAYRDAKSWVDRAYQALSDTPDGQWRAALLRLHNQRDRVIAAADAVDDASRWICSVIDRRLPESVRAKLPPLETLLKEENIDIKGWDLGNPDDPWFTNTCTGKLKEEFEGQDQRIASVARLMGDRGGTK